MRTSFFLGPRGLSLLLSGLIYVAGVFLEASLVRKICLFCWVGISLSKDLFAVAAVVLGNRKALDCEATSQPSDKTAEKTHLWVTLAPSSFLFEMYI